MGRVDNPGIYLLVAYMDLRRDVRIGVARQVTVNAPQ